ncbi:MAG: 16S rRNA (guanine(527)-N(7))-methyltransferase RsmG [Bacteroidia bacterium]
MISLLEKYFPSLSGEQKRKFDELQSIYQEWNQKINLISRKEIHLLVERHVLHSLAIAKFTAFNKGTKILDVGTGGGFPGIPLAIVFPEAEFYLIDSIGKKIMVVKDVIERLDLKNANAEKIRADEVKGKFDFIVSRAVAPFPELVVWTHNKINKERNNSLPNGFIFLKGGDLKEELRTFRQAQVFELKDFFEEDFFETKKLVYMPWI